MDGVRYKPLKAFPGEGFEYAYKRKRAVGCTDIRTDAMFFRFRKETFTLPVMVVNDITIYNGYFYEAPVAKLRALAKEQDHGRAK